MRKGPKGNTDKVIADAEKIAQRYRNGDKIKQLTLEYHSQFTTIKQAILTQMSVDEYRQLVSQHCSRSQKGKHSGRKGPIPEAQIPDRHPGKKPPDESVEYLRMYYEGVEEVLIKAAKKENYKAPSGYSKGHASSYVNALDADRMLTEAGFDETP